MITLHTYDDKAVKIKACHLSALLRECEFGVSIEEFLDEYTWDDTEYLLDMAEAKGYPVYLVHHGGMIHA